jgi:type II secretory pathway pseudopilin PulG
MYKLYRHYITLIEMMIVIFLIALITGVLAYNYRGSLEAGKAASTRMGMERLESILDLATSENPKLGEDLESNWQDIVKNSPLVANPDALIKDGWGNTYDVQRDDTGKITITSKKYEDYQRAHNASSQ